MSHKIPSRKGFKEICSDLNEEQFNDILRKLNSFEFGVYF